MPTNQSAKSVERCFCLNYGTARALIAQSSKTRWRPSPARGEVYSFDVGGTQVHVLKGAGFPARSCE